jgi:hypothetical protein
MSSATGITSERKLTAKYYLDGAAMIVASLEFTSALDGEIDDGQ